eukprot:845653_1
MHGYSSRGLRVLGLALQRRGSFRSHREQHDVRGTHRVPCWCEAARGVPLYRHIATLAVNNELVMPLPDFNIINGVTHGGNALATLEFMSLPIGAQTFKETMQVGSEVFRHLKKII